MARCSAFPEAADADNHEHLLREFEEVTQIRLGSVGERKEHEFEEAMQNRLDSNQSPSNTEEKKEPDCKSDPVCDTESAFEYVFEKTEEELTKEKSLLQPAICKQRE
ncbi:uncharacterized protein LOC119182665 [Rhipicephalus microplus]|uniref:uncharacterized protein LOC119182665 n=1 Tax=Rhipicephalus microplus TaxID=6941 RepID=UPI003F6C7896